MPAIIKLGLVVKKEGMDAIIVCKNSKEHLPKKERIISTEKYSNFMNLLKRKDRVFYCSGCGCSFTIPKIK